MPDMNMKPEVDAQPDSYQESREFVATVAHEMRTPLNAAAGFLSFLLQDMAGPLSAMQRDIVASIATSVDQAQTLVEDLLCMAQMDRGELSLQPVRLDLKALIRETLSQFRVMAEAAQVRLEGRNLDGPEAFVIADRVRLGQCLRNLIGNALKFSPTGEVVYITLGRRKKEYFVVVEDKGPGIAPEFQETIFDRHFQIKDSAARHLNGYGLGLSITRQLLERQQGRVWVESTLGKGSRFYFSLPVVEVISPLNSLPRKRLSA
ncbi:MAG TPA: HAMP domain-containing sensor histidine kinase [Chloroflexia bacterium]|nr:HAMP domain-containing sensor histidine kinase [Chloroflexia bacterium]